LLEGAPQLDRFQDVLAADLFLSLQVSDGARQAQHAVIGARRPLHFVQGRAQRVLSGCIRFAEAVDLAWRELLVGFALACQLALERGVYASGYRLGSFTHGVGLKHIRRYGTHFDLHVDAVQQRSRDAALVAQDLVWRALAGLGGMAQVSARAGIHGRDQLEAGGKVGVTRGAGDGDPP